MISGFLVWVPAREPGAGRRHGEFRSVFVEAEGCPKRDYLWDNSGRKGPEPMAKSHLVLVPLATGRI